MEDGVKRRSFLVANCAPAAIVESSLPSELRSYRFFFNIYLQSEEFSHIYLFFDFKALADSLISAFIAAS